MRSSAAFFFFNDTATTEIYTLSLHDALPIYRRAGTDVGRLRRAGAGRARVHRAAAALRVDRPRRGTGTRSEEHTSELQSQSNLVCRLLLEKKKQPLAREPEAPLLSQSFVCAR